MLAFKVFMQFRKKEKALCDLQSAFIINSFIFWIERLLLSSA